MSPQKFVAPRRAIAANDVDLGVESSKFGLQIVKEIEDSRIKVANVSCPPISQIGIQFRKRLRNVVGSATINNIKSLSTMSVKEPQLIFALAINGSSRLGNRSQGAKDKYTHTTR
jgi:hypothetical protein